MARITYPYLATYRSGTQYEEVIVWMTGPQDGLIIYIPPDLEDDDARYDLYLTQRLSPSNSELETYTGSVIVRGTADPVKGN